MHLSDLSRDTVSRGSMANDSLPSEAGRRDDCDCYCRGWSMRGGSSGQWVCARSRNES